MGDTSSRCPLFKTEEDAVEPKEEGTDRRRERAKRWITESRCVNPRSLGHPLLRCSESVCRVWSGQQYRCEAGNRQDNGDISYCLVEPLRFNEEAKHHRHDKAS